MFPLNELQTYQKDFKQTKNTKINYLQPAKKIAMNVDKEDKEFDFDLESLYLYTWKDYADTNYYFFLFILIRCSRKWFW